MFRRRSDDETDPDRDETIFRLSCRTAETGHDYQSSNEPADSAETLPGDSQMRPLSFILAFAFVMAGPSLVGSSDSGLPGTGTFSYNGSPIVTSAPMVVAAN